MTVAKDFAKAYVKIRVDILNEMYPPGHPLRTMILPKWARSKKNNRKESYPCMS